MTRHITALIIVLGLVIAPLAAEGIQQFSLAERTYSETAVRDQRSDLEKLADRVAALETENAQQQEQINLLAAMVDSLDQDLASAESGLAALDGFIDTSGESLTIQADAITLAADDIELDGDVLVTDDLECDTLTAEEVDAATYQPGAGNVW